MHAVSASVGSPRLRAIAGNAVVTIVPSSISMKNAAATMSATRRGNAVDAGSAATGGDADSRESPGGV